MRISVPSSPNFRPRLAFKTPRLQVALIQATEGDEVLSPLKRPPKRHNRHSLSFVNLFLLFSVPCPSTSFPATRPRFRQTPPSYGRLIPPTSSTSFGPAPSNAQLEFSTTTCPSSAYGPLEQNELYPRCSGNPLPAPRHRHGLALNHLQPWPRPDRPSGNS